MYTSGCPKNQNKCWYNTGSPPPQGSKKVVLKFRSVKSIVMAPARTGRDRRRRIVVIKIDQTKRGICSIFIVFIFKIVQIKLMEPKIDEIPARWSLKIPQSTADLLWYKLEDSGGYTVQPVPIPFSIIEDINKNVKEGGNNQNLILFIRGKAISGELIIKGTNQLPNPPIIAGITMKKIIMKAWAVTKIL